jgi:hypothetical protein
MKRRFTNSTCAIIVLFSLLLSPMGVGDAKQKRDVLQEAPENRQQSSFFNIHTYLKMEDPRRAAILMLEDARKHGVDIDAVRQRDVVPGRIRLPYATIEPDSNDSSFVEAVSRSQDQSGEPKELMCIIQFSRFCSVRETAGILSLGVRFFMPLHTYGRIAKIPADQLETLLDLPYVIWIGPYLPSYKYNINYDFDFDWDIEVFAFIDDEEVIRADLEEIGAEVSGQHRRHATVRLSRETLEAVANIWWVEKIYQSPPDVWEQNSSVEHCSIPQSNPQDDFNACDSRRLVSMR